MKPVIERVCAGAFAGLILGMLVELFIFWPPPGVDPSHLIIRFGDGLRFPLIGPVVGIVACVLLGVRFGETELRGVVKHVAIGFLAGAVIGGAVIGAGIFSPLMLAFDEYPDGFIDGKCWAIYCQAGVVLGTPIGAVAGVLFGVAVSMLKRRLRTTTNKAA